MNFFNKHKLTVLSLVIFLFPYFVQAGTCSPVGYTLYTVNGINTTKDEASNNLTALEKILAPIYNNQPITLDFLYNKSHGKVLDSLDTTNQIYFDQNSLNIQDSDFMQMLTDASAKLNTQKVLLVSHSQGNFYANTFYDAVADESGGVPSASIGVYGVASPASRVAGGGLYLTSKTDKMISGTVAKFPFTKILPWNINIDFKESDGDSLGHSFSQIYLAYQGDRIVSDIKSSLGRLQNNNIQKENSSCINPPKLTWVQKIQGPMLVVVDYTISPVLDSGLYVTTGAYKLASAIGNSVLSGISTTASALASLTSSKTTFYNLNNLAINNPSSVIVADDQLAEIDQNMNTSPEPVPENLKPATIPKPQTETTPPPKMQVKTNTTFVAVASVPQTKFLRSGVIITPSTETSLDQGGEDLPAQTEGGNSEPNPPAEEEIIPPVEEVSSVDKISPVITILGNDSETMVVGSVYIDAGATAFDEVDGDITVNIITVNLVDTAVPGTYTVTYNVSDAKGNAAMQMTRTVNVVIPGPAQLLGHMIYGAFYFDNPTILNNYTKIIYKGHYPDISFVYSGLTLPIELVSVQTVGCGWICGSKNGEYYWFDLDSDEGHYIFEVHRNGPSGLMDWEVIDPFSKVILSSSKEILSFNFEYLNPEVFGVIDQNNHTINLSVPFGTDVTKLMPGILLSDTTASVAPLEYVPRDFTNPVTYIVTAQDYSTQTYTVNVTIESDTNPPL